jgi:hypothetical protein
MTLTVDELLLGGSATHVVTVPTSALAPASGSPGADAAPTSVTLRPLVLADIQRIHKAAADSTGLVSAFMVQQALVEPAVTLDQVQRMHAGLVEFLLGEVNRISGMALDEDELTDAVHAPLARACFTLSRQFGWTPEECAALTVGQVLLYLEMLARGEQP